MMPNALKLDESVEETAKECTLANRPDVVIIPSSSATIAAGVIKGYGRDPEYVVHLGYSRSHDEVLRYIALKSGLDQLDITLIDEGYSYKDKAKDGPTPPWPCNEYYDLKAFRWWMRVGRGIYDGKRVLFWNVG